MYLGIDHTWQNQVTGCINILGRVRINSRIDSLNSTVLACDVVLAGSAVPVSNQTISNYQVVIVQIRKTKVMDKRVNKFKAFCRYEYACFTRGIVPLALSILYSASTCLNLQCSSAPIGNLKLWRNTFESFRISRTNPLFLTRNRLKTPRFEPNCPPYRPPRS